MAKWLTYTDSDGRFCILMPGYDDVDRPDNQSDLTLLYREAGRHIPRGTPFTIVDESEIPVDRSRRDEWEDDGTGRPRVRI